MRPILVAGFLAVSLLACNDGTGAGERPQVRVLLTDAPFPYDSVARVDVYFVRIMATTRPDTGTSADDTVALGLHTIATPRRRINLLDLSNGRLDSLGADTLLPSEAYQQLRVTINVDSSRIEMKDGTRPAIDFSAGGLEEMSFGLFPLAPVAMGPQGASILIDFNVGRSFEPVDPTGGARSGFRFVPFVRALNLANVGIVKGRVVGGVAGSPPVPNASVTLFGPGGGSVGSTARTESDGRFAAIVAVSNGAYSLRVEGPPSGPYGVGPSVPTAIGVTAPVTIDVGMISIPLKPLR